MPHSRRDLFSEDLKRLQGPFGYSAPWSQKMQGLIFLVNGCDAGDPYWGVPSDSLLWELWAPPPGWAPSSHASALFLCLAGFWLTNCYWPTLNHSDPCRNLGCVKGRDQQTSHILSTAFVNTILLDHSPCVRSLPSGWAASRWLWLSWVVSPGTPWPTELQMVSLWPLQKKCGLRERPSLGTAGPVYVNSHPVCEVATFCHVDWGEEKAVCRQRERGSGEAWRWEVRRRANRNGLWTLSSVPFLRLLGFIGYPKTLVIKASFF